MKYLKLLITPLCIIALVAILGLIWKWLDLPPKEDLIQIIKTYFEMYGIILVFLSAIIESILIVGFYAPGSTVIFLGVILSGGNPLKALLVVLSVIAGFLIGLTLDFYLGKFGWYKILIRLGFGGTLEKTKDRIKKYGITIPCIGYHNPALGSFIATAYGIMQFSYLNFIKITILPVIAWCAFWGLLSYFLGMKALSAMGWQTLLIMVAIWIIARVIEMKIEEKTGIEISKDTTIEK